MAVNKNESAIDKLVTPRGKRPASTTAAPAVGKRASVRTAPAPTEAEPDTGAIREEVAGQGTADLAPTPKKRGPKPGSKRTPKEAVARNTFEAKGFDMSGVVKGLKTQLNDLRAQLKDTNKAYKAEAKNVQAAFSAAASAVEKTERRYEREINALNDGVAKLEATLASLA